MKRALSVVIAVMFITGSLWAPKKIWTHHMQNRLTAIEQMNQKCGRNDSQCRVAVSAQLESYMHDITNPPWYVIGAGQE